VDEKLIEWLKEQLNQYAFLQLSHPYIVTATTENDQQCFQRLMKFLQPKRTVTMKEIRECIVTNWDSGQFEWGDTVENICELFKEKNIEVEK